MIFSINQKPNVEYNQEITKNDNEKLTTDKSKINHQSLSLSLLSNLAVAIAPEIAGAGSTNGIHESQRETFIAG